MTQPDGTPTELESFPALQVGQIWQCRDQRNTCRITEVHRDAPRRAFARGEIGPRGDPTACWSYDISPVYTEAGPPGYALCGVRSNHKDVLVRLLYDPE